MSEVRKDPTTGRVSVYAPERSSRPKELPLPSSDRPARPEYSPTCPFCPGNEASLAGIILETKDEDGTSWRTRVVANKYPAFSPEARTRSAKRGGDRKQSSPGGGIFESHAAGGHHEVVIESPRHDTDLARMPLAMVGSLIDTCHARYLALMSDAQIRTIIIFRNHGAAAGATLAHPHSQIVAMPFIPPEIERRQNIAARHAQAHGRCLFCDIVDGERREGTRVIRETEDFISFVPYAAAMPFEIWIVPKRHQTCFALIEPEERAGLADLLRDMVARIGNALGGPGYNLVLASLTGADAADGTHWYLAIHPRPITLGGFEIGAGMTINPSLPEQDARRLRSAR